MNVLVVDDDQLLRVYMRGLLEAEGYRVTEAISGVDALEMLLGAMPDCILLDLVLPGLNGFETLRSMRKRHGSLPPVVLVSMLAAGSVRAYATKVNKADGFVRKTALQDPIEGLVPTIRQAIAAQRGAAQGST